MKMMPYGVAAALLLGGPLLSPPALAWDSGAQNQSSSAQQSQSQSQPISQNQLSIRDLQQELKQAGLYDGAIDGVWGPESRSAMQQYQSQHGLNPSGQLDHDTLQAMRGDNGTTQSGGSGLDESSPDVGMGGSGMTGPSSDIGRDGTATTNSDTGAGAPGWSGDTLPPASSSGSSDEEQR